MNSGPFSAETFRCAGNGRGGGPSISSSSTGVRAARIGRPVYASVTTVSSVRSASRCACGRAGLGREEEGGPEGDARRPEPQHLGDAGSVDDPAGGDDGQRDSLDAGGHELGERHERKAVEERPAVPAGLGSLRDHGVHSRLLERPRFLGRRRCPEHDDARVA